MSRDRVVSNASPLIYLAKAGRLHLLHDLYREVLIPDEVFRETCMRQNTADSVPIRSAIDDGWIKVRELDTGDAQILSTRAGIDAGEAAAILLAKETRLVLLIDDKMGRSAAEILDIRCLGSVGVLLQTLHQEIVGLTEFKMVLDKMIDVGFYLDTKVYSKVLRVAEEISQK
ncbi:MAG: hypothetical protein BAJATHORv1_20546 [Candidatus Thorarchaeota archaeon]|nr:MAG: hypothetical protein BAJATHORv1_20546 [Candidatus Thorarchaeota archaeon]